MAQRKVGAFTFAFGRQYQRMAALQAHSFAHYGIDMSVVIEAYDEVHHDLTASPANVIRFDRQKHKAMLPFEFERWAFELSPYDLTIKTDADLLVPRGWIGLPPWVDHLPLVSAQPISIQGAQIKSSPYRRQWAHLGLPEVHSAFFTFDHSDKAVAFFQLVHEWYDMYFERAIQRIEPKPSTDLIYSLAWNQLFGRDLGPTISFYHMKHGTSGFDNWHDNWTERLSYLNDVSGSYINGVRLIHPLHYYDKSFIENQHVHLD